jgi:hypothetical protein
MAAAPELARQGHSRCFATTLAPLRLPVRAACSAKWTSSQHFFLAPDCGGQSLGLFVSAHASLCFAAGPVAMNRAEVSLFWQVQVIGVGVTVRRSK